MSNKSLNKFGGYAGIVAVLFLILGFIFGSSAGSSCDMQTIQVSSCIFDLRAQLATAGFLNGLAVLFFVIFSGKLYSTLRKAEGDEGWLSIVIFSSAAIWAAVWLVGQGLFLSSIELGGYYNNAEGARTIFGLADEFLFGRGSSFWFLPASLMLGGTYIIAKSTQIFSKVFYRYSGISSILIIIASAMYSIQGIWLIFPVLLLFYVWIFSASLALVRQTT